MQKYSHLFHGAVRSRGDIAGAGLTTAPETGGAGETQAAAVTAAERAGATGRPRPKEKARSSLLLPVSPEKTGKPFPELASLSKVGKAKASLRGLVFRGKAGRELTHLWT